MTDEILNWLLEDSTPEVKLRTLKEYLGLPDDHERVILAHQLGNPPKNFDEYLIVDKIDREAKEEYCQANGIPYKVIGFNKENPDGATHGFKLCAFLNNAGHQVGCAARRVVEDVRSDGVDYRRINKRGLYPMTCCPHCKAAIDAWRFL